MQPQQTRLLPNGARVADEAVRRVHIRLAQKAQVALGALLHALLPLVLGHAANEVLMRHLSTGRVAQAAQVSVQPLEGQQKLMRKSDFAARRAQPRRAARDSAARSAQPRRAARAHRANVVSAFLRVVLLQPPAEKRAR